MKASLSKNQLSTVFAGMLALLSPASAEATEQTRTWVSHVLWWACMPQEDSYMHLRESYTIRSWDTFSRIAARKWILYNDFILFLQVFNPWIDIHATIRPWDTFYILSPTVDQEELDRYRQNVQEIEKVQRITKLWNDWKKDEVLAEVRYHITPPSPQNIWVRKGYQTMANMFEQWYRIGPRSAMPELENQAVCKHVLSQTFARIVWLNASWPARKARQILIREDTPAWVLPHRLASSSVYNRDDQLDLRRFFTRNFSTTRQAIRSQYRDEYQKWLLRQLEFLRTDDAIACFIPTLFHGTNYAETALRESGGRDMNSHIFACNGFSYSEVFSVDSYWFSEGIKWNFQQVLVDMIRDLWGIYRYQSASNTAILRGLSHIHKYIVIEVQDSHWTWMSLHFDKDLSIANIDAIDISDIQWFRTWGNILTDGFQITPHEWETLIEQRLSPDWVVYASHFFNVFHSTSILVASDELLDAQSTELVWNFIPDIPIRKYISINTQEAASISITTKYKNEISHHIFWNIYQELGNVEKRVVDQMYSIHSLWLQMLWYHSFDGTQWNPWSSYQNAWVPVIDVFTQSDIDKLRSLYRDYISEKRSEYQDLLSQSCKSWENIQLPVFYFQYFPWETSQSIWNTLVIQVSKHSPQLAQTMQTALLYQRHDLMQDLFWKEVVMWNISAWWEWLLDVAQTIEKIKLYFEESVVWEKYTSQLSPQDNKLVESIISNSQTREAIAYYLIKEWYVPDRRWWSTQNILPNFIVSAVDKFISRFKRKDRKRYYVLLDEKGYLERNQTLLKQVSIKQERLDAHRQLLPNIWISWVLRLPLDWYYNTLDFLKNKLWKIPSRGPSSHWDLQLRFMNLLNPETALNIWPSRWDLDKAIGLLDQPSPQLTTILDEYKKNFPEQYWKDMRIVEDIKKELSTEAPNGRKIYTSLVDLFNINDETNTYLLWKIISISLSEALHNENIWHICEQLQRIWNTCLNLSSRDQENLNSYALLMMNKSPQVALSIKTENYMFRLFEWLHSHYDIPLPSVHIRESNGIETKPILNYFELRRRMTGYREHYIPYINQYETVWKVVDIIEQFLKSEENRAQRQFDLLWDPVLHAVFHELWLETSSLPSKDEVQWNTHTSLNQARNRFFAYNNSNTIQNFVVEPEQKSSDFVIAPFIFFVIYGQAFWSLFWVMLWKLKKYNKRKRYLKSIVLTNDPKNPYKKRDYRDWRYKIWVDAESLPTIKKFLNILVLESKWRVDNTLQKSESVAAE